MTIRRRARNSHARRQRQEEDCPLAYYTYVEPSLKTTIPVHLGILYFFRRVLLCLGIVVLASALVSVVIPQFARSEAVPFLAKSDAAMARMMAAMKIKRSSDVDKDFVAMMVPHHQGAIDMAQAELSYGHNERLRRLAQEITVTQQEEIVTMRLALASMATSQLVSSEEAPFLAKSDAAMVRMMAAMKIKRSSDVDKDFVAMMVPHHQGAIDMAQAELSYGHNEQLCNLAQEIIATQQQEIVAMQIAELPSSVLPPNQPS